MDRPNDPRFGVGQQNRRTVRRDDAEKQSWAIGDERVGVGPLAMRNGLADDDRLGRMDLVDAGQRRAREDRVGGDAAVGLDRFGIVAAAKPAIEPHNITHGNSAGAPEEAMRNVAQHRRSDDVEAHSFSRMTISSSAWLPTMK